MHPDLKKYLLYSAKTTDYAGWRTKRGHIMKDHATHKSWCGRTLGHATVACNGACRRCVKLYESSKEVV